MMVYGDPCHDATLSELLSHLKSRLKALRHASGTRLLNDLRQFLCAAGQLEQAADDAPPSHLTTNEAHLPERLREITDQAAKAFYHQCLQRPTDVQSALATLACDLDPIHAQSPAPLHVKTPEGFAFYGLYPEQYYQAAHDWLADHQQASPRRAIVIGIRSIGTTLSALVAAALRAHGWAVRRMTVRPTGHPFARRVAIAPAELHGAAYALVVDEGPGLSGSSMAAAAHALANAGLNRQCISFLPGHANPPGHAASDPVRTWWTTTPRYVTPLDQLQWQGRPLPEILAARTSHLCGPADPLDHTENLGGGLWRKVVYSDPAHWPAVYAQFEPMKYRCVLQSGAAILWKFAGFVGQAGKSDIETLAVELQARAQRGWTPTCLDTTHGFIAMPWINGTPLTRADATSIVLTHIGRYIADVAGPPLSPSEQADALTRLREMLIANTREALGEPAATRAQQWSDAAADLREAIPPPAYGDGRMAPHEWLRTSSGQLVKVDPVGHNADHTLIGRQSLLWDLAGASIEWGLEDTPPAPLLHAIPELPTTPMPLLAFYRMAYAAFRLGMCTLGARLCPDDPDEQARLRHTRDSYRAQLTHCLESPP